MPVEARRSSFVAVALLVAASSLAGCGTTPTLPLPPPVAVVGAVDVQGLALVQGEAKQKAFVTVLNTHSEEGRIGRAGEDGRFAIEIPAQAGDSLEVWQEVDGVEGEHNQLTVPE